MLPTIRSRKSRSNTHLNCESLEDRRLLAITLQPLGTYSTGIFDESAAEIVAHDAASQRLFVTNVNDQSVDIIDMQDPSNPSRVGQIDTSGLGDEPSSVSVHGGLLAVAVRNDKDNPVEGKVALYDISAAPQLVKSLTAGFGPDMLTFTPDGTRVLVANQGRPSEDYEHDPEGSVSIIDVSGGANSATITTATFQKYNGLEGELRDNGVRIFGPSVENGVIVGAAPAANDLEPENIAVSPDSSTAWVTLQENNAVGILDIPSAEFTEIQGLGYKNHRAAGNGLDASDRDGGINIDRSRVKGMYQPDGIATYVVGDEVFLLTANEGNERDNDEGPFNEATRLKDATVVKGLQHLQADDRLGRLNVTLEPPHGKHITKQGEVVLSQLYSFGTRSFSVWNRDAELVFDSGDDFGQIIAEQFPENFNASDDNDFDGEGNPDNLDSRSDNKGPEPESVTVGTVGGSPYAFVGLERMGGVMIYDVANPHAPVFQSYVNRRDFNEPNTITISNPPVEITNPDVGDLAVEGMVFIAASDSPTGTPLLVTANEVSGTTTIFEVVDDESSAKVELGAVGAAVDEFLGERFSSEAADSDSDDGHSNYRDQRRQVISNSRFDLEPTATWRRDTEQFFEFASDDDHDEDALQELDEIADFLKTF